MTAHTAPIEHSVPAPSSELQPAHRAAATGALERQLELDRLQAAAMGAPRRTRALLAAVLVVGIAGSAFFWHRQHAGAARAQHAAAVLEPAGSTRGSLQGKLQETDLALAETRRRVEHLREQLSAMESQRQQRAAMESERPEKGNAPGREQRVAPRRERTEKATQPGRGPIDLGKCAHSPLGCAP